MLTLKAFGPLDVRDDDGRPLTSILAQSKRAALFAYLVLERSGELHRRDALLALFWPELDQSHARNALSQALTFLRREVGDDVLLTRGDEEVGVDAGGVSSDVRVFEDAVAGGAWERALEVYGGNLLEGLHVTGAPPFMAWADRASTRLRHAAAEAAWQCAHQRLGAGSLMKAERAARRALALVPTTESQARAFIQALADAGDRAAALRFYRRFVDVLARELDVAPAPETVAVVEVVRRRSAPVTATEEAGAQRRPPSGSSGSRSGAVAGTMPADGARRTSRTVGLVVLGGTLVVTLVGVLARSSSRPFASPVERFHLDIEPLGVPGVLPDGSGVVYNGERQLMLRRWTSITPTPVPGTEGVRENSTPAVSPSGEEVAFVVDGHLKVAPFYGGPARTLADSVFCCPRWGPEGFIYFSEDGEGIDRVPASGGPAEPVLRAEPGKAVFNFQVLPGGEVAVFSRWSDTGQVVAMRMSSGERRVLARGKAPYVTSTGHLIFGTSDGRILAAPFDAEELALRGPVRPLVEDALVFRGYPVYSLSANGTLVYAAGTPAGESLRFSWVTRTGVLTPAGTRMWFQPGWPRAGWRLSPDGLHIAFGRRVDGNSDVWIETLPGGPISRLTSGDASEGTPRWSPDNSSITYTAGPAGEGTLWSTRAGGAGGAELLFDGINVVEGFWSPDGRWLVLRRGGYVRAEDRDILGIRPGRDTTPVPLVATPEFVEQAPALSRDGRWLAYTSDRTGRQEVFVRPFPDVAKGRWPVSREGGIQPVWAHNGHELFFLNPETRELKVTRFTTADDTFRPDPPTTLFVLPPSVFVYVDGNMDIYDVSPDDQRFLVTESYAPERGSPSTLLVRNLLEELEARESR